MMVESFPENITCSDAVVFKKWVKQCHENNVNLSDHETKNVFSFTNFSKTTAPKQLIF